jgi:glyoxylase-like metal-dependent hydrolase (beta-lactamase superfamily II)
MAAAVALALAALAAAPVTPEVPDPDLDPIRIAPNIWMVQGELGTAPGASRSSNAAFVITREGVVVVDALGTPALGRGLVLAIRKVTSQKIRRVILTHYHPDHALGAEALRAAGAELWAHQNGRAFLAGDEPERLLEQRRRELGPRLDATARFVPADRWIEGETTFELGGVQVEVLPLGPAHSAEDVVVALPGEGVIFAGDLVLAGRIPVVGDTDTRRWIDAIDRLLQLHSAIAVGGHGPPSHDPAAHLALTRDYLLYLRRVMGAAVQGLVPFDDAYAATDWSAWSSLPAFDQANRANAYATYVGLERELLEAGHR